MHRLPFDALDAQIKEDLHSQTQTQIQPDMKDESLREFAKSCIPLFDEKYEMFLAKPEDLVGKKVISICSGFSCSGGGQVMVVESIEDNVIILGPCEETYSSAKERNVRWSTNFKDKHKSIIFYNEDKKQEYK